jgi:hypothetical protein
MLAEKFMLLLEVLRSHTCPDGNQRVVSLSPHIPVKLPDGKPHRDQARLAGITNSVSQDLMTQ